MISPIDPSGAMFLANLAQIQNNMQQAQTELSSGLKFQNASDAPDQVSDILSMRASISNNNQVQSNLNNVTTQVTTAQQALSSAEQLVENALTLATQGATGTATATSNAALAQQVGAIQSELISLANTQVGTNYVFGGDDYNSQPYEADTVNPDTGGGVVQLTVTQASRQIQDPLGNTFSVDLTAQQIFDDQNPDGTPAADNVFTAVNQLRVSLQNNDSAGIQSSITALTTADDYLNQQLGFYGAAENRLQAATSLSQQMNLTYQTALGSDQDADMAQAATQLTESQTQEQAALQAQSMEPRTSLFNFLG
jgi:flagellar hook-associated protein 3 FlgL